MNQKRKPTAKDPLKRLAVLTPKRQSVITGPQPGGTYIRKDGTTMRKKTLWLEDTVARRFSAFCAQHHMEESSLAQDAIERAMLEWEG